MKTKDNICERMLQNDNEITKMREYDDSLRSMAKQAVYSLDIWVLENENSVLQWVLDN